MTAVAIRVFDSEAGTTTDYAFTTSPVRIGRNPLNDLSLPFPFVSGWHAVVRFDAGDAKFFDLGSTNGTLHNGRRVQAGEAIPVVGEVSLTIGKLELRVRRDEAAVASAPVMTDVPVHSPAAYSPTAVHASAAMPAPIEHPTAMPGVMTQQSQPAAHTGSPAGTAAVDMGDVHQSVHRLRPHYDAYRQGWTALQRELLAALQSMPAEAHGFALSILQREFPDIAGEAEFKQLARQAGAAVDAPPSSAGGGSSDAVQRLASSLRPGDPPPANTSEEQRFMSCVEDVLRASAKALVELQKGQEQFGNEMGVRTIKEYTALHAAGSPEAILAYLLDWKAGGTHRTQELVGVYADLMIHQVALINGLMEGVRSVLARLSPQEIERGVTSGWPTRAAAIWKQYVERHQQLAQEDKNLTAVVFGPEFARAYAEVGGEGSS